MPGPDVRPPRMMRRSWPVSLLLAGALLLLASLYLPWEASRQQLGDAIFFRATATVDGWSSGVGDAAALFGLLLACVAVTALARPNLLDRLPLGRCALLASYFGLAVGAQARSVAHERASAHTIHFHYGSGAYLGVAGAVVVLLAAGALRRRELVHDRSASRLGPVVVAVGLLVAFLLPWERLASPTFLGIGAAPAVIAAVLIVLAGASPRVDAAERLVLCAAAALFTAAAFSSLTFPVSRAYGAWIGLAAAGAGVALALANGLRVPRTGRLPWSSLAVCGAATVFVAGLFLPWQKSCYQKQSDLGVYSGHCVATNGWTTTLGTAAAVLAIGLVVVTLVPRWVRVSGLALATAIALLVATIGFQLEIPSNGGGFHFELGYGSMIGFTAAGLLLALALVRPRPSAIQRNRIPLRLAPIAACAAYLVVLLLPWWDVLPRHLQSTLRFAPVSWVTLAGVLLAVWLVHLWIRRIAGAVASDDRLVLIPLVLLALAALDLIRLRQGGITWGGGSVVGLCLVLAWLGYVEQHEGLENVRVPELLRVDRL